MGFDHPRSLAELGRLLVSAPESLRFSMFQHSPSSARLFRAFASLLRAIAPGAVSLQLAEQLLPLSWVDGNFQPVISQRL